MRTAPYWAPCLLLQHQSRIAFGRQLRQALSLGSEPGSHDIQFRSLWLHVVVLIRILVHPVWKREAVGTGKGHPAAGLGTGSQAVWVSGCIGFVPTLHS